jgi:hypothetical protein
VLDDEVAVAVRPELCDDVAVAVGEVVVGFLHEWLLVVGLDGAGVAQRFVELAVLDRQRLGEHVRRARCDVEV